MADCRVKEQRLVPPGGFSALNCVRAKQSVSPSGKRRKPSPARLELLARPRSVATQPLTARPLSSRPLSPGRPSACEWALRTVTLVRPSLEEELTEASNTVSRLHAEVTKLRQSEASLRSDCKRKEDMYQAEILKLQGECAGLQGAALQAKSRCASTHLENSRLLGELEEQRRLLEKANQGWKALAGALLDAVESAGLKPGSQAETLKEEVTMRLRELAQDTQANLSEEILRVGNWLSPRPLPPTARKEPHPSLSASGSTMKEIPFFELGETPDFSPPVEARTEEEEDEETQELEEVKRNVLHRISSGPRRPSSSIAVAQFDFPGQEVMATQDGDLKFARGDHIAVLRTDPQGWWLGEKDGQRGIFPFNYVRLL